MNGRGFFITGTNTDVGKTVVTRALARLLSRRGLDVVAVKPVESGVDQPEQSDAYRLSRAAGGGRALEETTLYRFETPVSPHLAADLENQRVDAEALRVFLNGWLERADIVLAEGAGGLLVPLNRQLTYGDALASTDYRLIVVAPDVLGTINATLLTLEAARARGIEVAGVILNHSPSGMNLGNKEAISAFGRVPVLGTMTTLPLEDDDVLADHLAQTFDADTLLSPGRSA